LSIRNFVPTIWSAKLFQELDKAHVLVARCNRDYEGEIRSFGDTVKINAVGDITVSNYAPNVTSVSPQQLTAAQTILEIDQAKYFAFYIDDVDNAQTNPKLMSEAVRKSAYALADTADQLIAGYYSQAGVTVNSTAVTQTNALNVLSQTAQKLDENNVPSQGRWMVIPPWYHQFLILNKILETEGSVVADQAYTNGYIGRAFGFDMYLSNNLSTGVKSAGSFESHYGLAGTARAMSFAEQVVSVEAYRPENSFADAVKGLHVYGGKVIDPNALVALNICSTSTST
jgi:hypothetical protein